jgi:hypothetical protein
MAAHNGPIPLEKASGNVSDATSHEVRTKEPSSPRPRSFFRSEAQRAERRRVCGFEWTEFIHRAEIAVEEIIVNWPLVEQLWRR